MTISPISLGNSFTNGSGATVLGGLSSGLNTQSVINGIVAAQSSQITPLNDQITVNNSQLSALTKLQQLLTALQTAVTPLANPQSPDATDNLWAVNTSNITSNTTQPASDFLTASVVSGTASGTYTISNISQLATASTQETSAFTVSPTTTPIVVASGAVAGQFNAGQITVTGPSGSATVTFNAGDTLGGATNSVVADFNAVSATTGLTAAVTQSTPGVYTLTFTNTSVSPATPYNFSLTSSADVTPVSGNVLGAQTSATYTLDPAVNPVVVASGAGNGQFNAGTIDITGPAGSGTVTLKAGDTLSEVAADFNAASSSTGISASAVQTSPGQYVLAFTSTTTGLATSFDLTSNTTVTSDPSGVLSEFNPTLHPGNTVLLKSAVTGNNASFELNGTTITRPTNAVSDLISGVTLNLLQNTNADPGASFTLQITPDTSSIEQGISNFATAYNNFLAFYATQTQLNSNGTAASAAVLYSDTTLRNIYNELSNETSSIVKGLSPGSTLNSLSTLGISFTTTPANGTTPAVANTLSVDSSALLSALQSNFTGVEGVFGAVLTSSSPDVALYQSPSAAGVTSFTLNTNQSPTTTPLVVASGAVAGQFNAGTIQITGPSGSGSVTFNTGDTLSDIVSDFNAATSSTGLVASLTSNTATGTNTLTFTNSSNGAWVPFDLTNSSDVTSDPSGVLSQQTTASYTLGDFSAFYTDPTTGKQTLVNLTPTSLGTYGSALTVPADSGALSGLELIYGSTNAASGITVSLSQGIADQIGNAITGILQPNTGLIADDQTAIQDKTTTLNTQITNITNQVATTRQQLLQEFSALEAAISSANTSLDLLNAQQLAGSSTGG